jgi:hypothetical protein
VERALAWVEFVGCAADLMLAQHRRSPFQLREQRLNDANPRGPVGQAVRCRDSVKRNLNRFFKIVDQEANALRPIAIRKGNL